MAIATINPATGEMLKSHDPLSSAEIDDRIGRAAAAFAAYTHTSFADRARWLEAAATILDAEARDIGRVMTMEMSKTITAAVAEVQKCARACRYFAERAESFLADEPVAADAVGVSRAYVHDRTRHPRVLQHHKRLGRLTRGLAGHIARARLDRTV